MSLELQIVRAAEFVRLGAEGELDFQRSKEALASLANACRKRCLDRALLDVRELPVPAQPRFSMAELSGLVCTFREAGFGPHQRLAVLYTHDPHRGVSRFAFISRLKGWQVRAFADFEKALLWLSEESSPRPERGGRSVPIKRKAI